MDTVLRVYDLNEACSILKMSRPTLLKLIKKGKLRAGKAGRVWRITENAIKEFAEGKTQEDNEFNAMIRELNGEDC